MRLFVALDIDPDIRERIAAFREEMGSLAPGVRWVGPETFHITLQFLGETNKGDAIKAALAQVKAVPVPLAFRGAGFFPTPQRARVFWVGIEAGAELQSLVANLGAALQPLGFKRDEGPYHPHLTLARAGSGRPHARPGDKASPGLQAVRAQLETQSPPEFGTMTAHQFILYQSTLTPTGSCYGKLAAFPLS